MHSASAVSEIPKTTPSLLQGSAVNCTASNWRDAIAACIARARDDRTAMRNARKEEDGVCCVLEAPLRATARPHTPNVYVCRS